MKALLIVDVQNDFCPGGALAVNDGDKIVPVINQLMEKFDWVVASKDWHLTNSQHFMHWPVHCVQNTSGARFHPKLNTDNINYILLKGTGKYNDGYSVFEATNICITDLLKKKNVNELYITGLATDYCVKFSAIDSIKRGFDTYVVTDAVKAVNLHPDDGKKALKEMKDAGCKLLYANEIIID